jgi:HSP20 family protein
MGKEVQTMPVKNLLPSIRRRGNILERQEEHPFYALQQEMNRVFDSFFRDFDILPFGAARDKLSGFYPSLDVKENEKEVDIKAELPGMDEKEVEVLLADNAVTIKGEKKEEKEDKGKDYYHMERSYGAFNRVIPLPQGLDTNKAEAHYKNGVLTIKIPKTEEAKAKVKKVSIKTK